MKSALAKKNGCRLVSVIQTQMSGVHQCWSSVHDCLYHLVGHCFRALFLFFFVLFVITARVYPYVSWKKMSLANLHPILGDPKPRAVPGLCSDFRGLKLSKFIGKGPNIALLSILPEEAQPDR